MDNTIVQVFNNSCFGELRITKDEQDNIWFVAKNVTTALGLDRPSQSTRYLDPDEKGMCLVDTPSGRQEMITISEAGLYSLILKSRKPEAKQFKRWVTHEVLPAIRRDGGYMVAKDETPEETMARAFIIAQSTIERQKARITQQSAQIEEMTPKALFADAVAASDGTCLVGELAKMLTQAGFKVGQNRLFKLLRDDGYLGKHGCNRNVPKQRYIEQGLFRIKETAVTHADGHVTLNRTPKCTGKGQRYFLAKYAHAMSIQA